MNLQAGITTSFGPRLAEVLRCVGRRAPDRLVAQRREPIWHCNSSASGPREYADPYLWDAFVGQVLGDTEPLCVEELEPSRPVS